MTKSMPLEPNDPRLVFVPVDEIIVPPGGIIMHYKDRFWVHLEGRVVFWKSGKYHLSPQCNDSMNVMNSLIPKLYPWANALFLPSAFRKVDPRDY